jgi:hypothetical protein
LSFGCYMMSYTVIPIWEIFFDHFSVTWDLGAFGKKVVKLTNQGDTFDDYEWRGSAVTSWYRISLMVWGRGLDSVPIREVRFMLSLR